MRGFVVPFRDIIEVSLICLMLRVQIKSTRKDLKLKKSDTMESLATGEAPYQSLALNPDESRVTQVVDDDKNDASQDGRDEPYYANKLSYNLERTTFIQNFIHDQLLSNDSDEDED